jgi:hypothetical protein
VLAGSGMAVGQSLASVGDIRIAGSPQIAAGMSYIVAVTVSGMHAVA